MTTMNIYLIFSLLTFDRPPHASSVTNRPLSHTMPCLKSLWRTCICYDVHSHACLKVNGIFSAQLMTWILIQRLWLNKTRFLLFFQYKRKFERDCKEADRAQQYFEKMDADINVTKADVEKVCAISVQTPITLASLIPSIFNTIAWPSSTQTHQAPSPLSSIIHYIFSPSVTPQFWLITRLSPDDSKDWVTVHLMPASVGKSLHCLCDTVVCC